MLTSRESVSRNDVSLLAAFASAGRKCNAIKKECEPNGNCDKLGSPYVHGHEMRSRSVHYEFAGNGCCRGPSVTRWEHAGDHMNYGQCRNECAKRSDCSSFEVNGCGRGSAGDPSKCHNACWLYFGIGTRVHGSAECGSTDGNQLCFRKPATDSINDSGICRGGSVPASCEQKPHPEHRRLCACRVTPVPKPKHPLVWMLAPSGQSCSKMCLDRHATCDAASLEALNNDDMLVAFAITKAGNACKTIKKGMDHRLDPYVGESEGFEFAGNGCCRGASVTRWENAGDHMTYEQCRNECAIRSECSSFEVNGCGQNAGDPSQCHRACWLFFGDGRSVHGSSACGVTDGSQRCFRRSSGSCWTGSSTAVSCEQSDYGHNNRRLCPCKMQARPFRAPWNGDSTQLTNWDSWCDNEIKAKGCRACQELNGAGKFCLDRCSSQCPLKLDRAAETCFSNIKTHGCSFCSGGSCTAQCDMACSHLLKCWAILPTGCALNALAEVKSRGDEINWFVDPNPRSITFEGCHGRVVDFNKYCGVANARMYWESTHQPFVFQNAGD